MTERKSQDQNSRLTNSKSQIPNPNQIPKNSSSNSTKWVGIWFLIRWELVGVWNLGFGICLNGILS
jgi:hypothetical protein